MVIRLYNIEMRLISRKFYLLTAPYNCYDEYSKFPILAESRPNLPRLIGCENQRPFIPGEERFTSILQAIFSRTYRFIKLGPKEMWCHLADRQQTSFLSYPDTCGSRLRPTCDTSLGRDDRKVFLQEVATHFSFDASLEHKTRSS